MSTSTGRVSQYLTRHPGLRFGVQTAKNTFLLGFFSHLFGGVAMIPTLCAAYLLTDRYVSSASSQPARYKAISKKIFDALTLLIGILVIDTRGLQGFGLGLIVIIGLMKSNNSKKAVVNTVV